MSSCSSNGMSALVALLTVGSQNEDINKNPQVSLFVYAHLRVTHFSQVIHNMNNASGDNSLTCGEQSFTFARNGDLLNQPYLRVDLPGICNVVTTTASIGSLSATHPVKKLAVEWCAETRQWQTSSDLGKVAATAVGPASLDAGDRLMLIESAAERHRAQVEAKAADSGDFALTMPGPECYWAWGVGYALVECMTLCMGNQQIDRSYGQWMSMWEELTDSTSNSTDNSLYAHTQAEYNGHIHPNTHCNFKTSVENRKRMSKTQSTVFVPVTLGWARTAAMSMPLVACTFNNVTVSLRSANLTSLIMNYGPELNARSGIAKDWISASGSKNNGFGAAAHTGGMGAIGDAVETLVLEACGSKLSAFGSCDAQFSYRLHTQKNKILDTAEKIRQGHAQVRLVANYVFLQQGERQKFAEGSHEQIIVQTQRQCESVSGCSLNVNSCSFHHPSAGVFAAVSADPKTVGVNREPLDSNGPIDSVNHVVRPAITHFNLSLNNAKVLPSSYDCELARYGDANAYNTLFRGAASKIQNGAVALLFCTDAMRAMIQPSGTVNFSRVDELCFSFRIAPELVKGLRDHHVRENAVSGDRAAAGDELAESIRATPVLQLTIYAINYNVIRYKAGMAGCKWAL